MLTLTSSHRPSSRTREAKDEGPASPARGPSRRRPPPGCAPAAPPPTRHRVCPAAAQGVELIDAPLTPLLLLHEFLLGGAEVRARGVGEGAGEEERRLGGRRDEWGLLGFHLGAGFCLATGAAKRSETRTSWSRPLVCGPTCGARPIRHRLI